MGMLLAIAYSKAALNGLRDVEPRKIRQRMKAKINALSTNPHPPGSVKVQGVMDGAFDVYRIRSGDYRVLYTLRGDSEVLVLDIGHRKDVYRNR